MDILGLQEISYFNKLYTLVCDDHKKIYSRSELGKLIDNNYPNGKAHSFLSRMIVLKIVVFSTSTAWRGKTIRLYGIDRKMLVDAVKSTKEYKMFFEFYEAETLIRVLQPGTKK